MTAVEGSYLFDKLSSLPRKKHSSVDQLIFAVLRSTNRPVLVPVFKGVAHLRCLTDDNLKYLNYDLIAKGSKTRSLARDLLFFNAGNSRFSNEAWDHAAIRCGLGEEGERWTQENPDL